jgi:AcrR family transcriptional regulator
VVAAVRRLARRQGRTPTVRQFCHASGIGQKTIYRHFTSWDEVCTAAGLPTTTARNRSRSERRRDLVEAVREMAASHGPNLTLRKFCQQRNISESRVYWDFASWRELRVAAGLSPHIDRSAASVIHTRQSLLAALQPIVAEVGPMVTLAAFRLRTGISDAPIARVFGSWRAMREAAGLPARVRPEPDPRHSHDALVELLRKIGHERPYITKREFCEENEVPTMTVDRVGPWSELRRKAYLPGNGSRAEAHNYEVTKNLIIHPQLWHELLIAPLEVPFDEMRADYLARQSGSQT